MPKETFWHPDARTSDEPRTFTVTWGVEQPCVSVNDVVIDRSATNRLIRVLRAARDKTYGRDE